MISMETRRGSATQKVFGGKLIRIDVTFTSTIESVKITGDFFLHPEDTLVEIEKKLTGVPLPIQKARLIQQIESILKERQAELIGASAADLVVVLDEAVSCCSD
jgi:lipoate-protein ligase A